MTRKTIYRYHWRCFQSETEQTGDGDQWRLSPMPVGASRSQRYPGNWTIRWLAERWTIEFPNGLHRARFSPQDSPYYHIGNRDHKCGLPGVVYLASVGQDGSRIAKHVIFPDPPEANPEPAEEPEEATS